MTFNTPSGQIAGLRWGHGTPILALHGWLDNAASFHALAPLLADHGHQVTAIDFPGHGLSDHRAPGHNYAFIDYLLEVQAVMAELPQPLILLGHSLGGAIALLYASAYPEQVKQLVVIENLGPIPPHQPGTASKNLRKALDLWQQHSPEHKRFYPDVETAIKARQQATPIPTELIRPLVERGLKQTAQGWHWRTDKRLRLPSLSRMEESQIQEFLNACQTPRQLILGEPRTQAMDHPMFSDRLKAFDPEMLVTIQGDHHLHLEKASEVATEVINFLKNR